MSQEVVIVGGARTPMAEYVGTPGFGKFKDVSAIDLAVHASTAALDQVTSDVAPSDGGANVVKKDGSPPAAKSKDAAAKGGPSEGEDKSGVWRWLKKTFGS